MQKKSVILISVLPACCSLRALFFTSSWERPSVTATRTLGTFLLMPLSDVNTLSPICFSAAPKAFTRIQTKYNFIVILFLLLTHLGRVKKIRKLNTIFHKPVLVFPPLYLTTWRADSTFPLSWWEFSLNSVLAVSLYCTKDTCFTEGEKEQMNPSTIRWMCTWLQTGRLPACQYCWWHQMLRSCWRQTDGLYRSSHLQCSTSRRSGTPGQPWLLCTLAVQTKVWWAMQV